MKNIDELTSLPNIGIILAEKLLMVGITSEQGLKAAGSEQSIIKIATIENSGTSINMLYALEAAIQGIHRYGLSKSGKEELKAFFRMMKSA